MYGQFQGGMVSSQDGKRGSVVIPRIHRSVGSTPEPLAIARGVQYHYTVYNSMWLPSDVIDIPSMALQLVYVISAESGTEQRTHFLGAPLECTFVFRLDVSGRAASKLKGNGPNPVVALYSDKRLLVCGAVGGRNIPETYFTEKA